MAGGVFVGRLHGGKLVFANGCGAGGWADYCAS
jgi:hypothetical protein